MLLLLALTIVIVAQAPGAAAVPEKKAVELSGEIGGRGLVMAESEKPIYRVHLNARVDRNGVGDGTLILDPTPNAVDEFGFPEATDALPPVKLDCSLKLVQRKRFLLGSPATGGAKEVEWRLLRITGPKITSRLSVASEAGPEWVFARFLVSDKDGTGRISVSLRTPGPFPPCHPGCFPAGTPIHVPGGTRAIERLRAGDVVTTVGPDGTSGQAKVASMSVTRNRLIEVRTEEGGTLATTELQPLSLAGGGLRAAGELRAGDRINSWDGRELRPVKVKSVAATGREAQVFNLVLGEPVLFVADGFLARSKPPAPATEPPRP